MAVIGEDGSASLGIRSNPLPSLIIVEAKSIMAAVSGRVALYSRSLTGAWPYKQESSLKV